MAEPTLVGKGMPCPPGSPEWERWMAACRAVLKIAPRTWPAYLLGWQLRRLVEAGVIVPAQGGQAWYLTEEQVREKLARELARE